MTFTVLYLLLCMAGAFSFSWFWAFLVLFGELFVFVVSNKR